MIFPLVHFTGCLKALGGSNVSLTSSQLKWPEVWYAESANWESFAPGKRLSFSPFSAAGAVIAMTHQTEYIPDLRCMGKQTLHKNQCWDQIYVLSHSCCKEITFDDVDMITGSSDDIAFLFMQTFLFPHIPAVLRDEHVRQILGL